MTLLAVALLAGPRQGAGWRWLVPVLIACLARAGMGLAVSAVALGERDPALQQVLHELPIEPLPLWLTAHRELRDTPRLRVIFDALAQAFAPGDQVVTGYGSSGTVATVGQGALQLRTHAAGTALGPRAREPQGPVPLRLSLTSTTASVQRRARPSGGRQIAAHARSAATRVVVPHEERAPDVRREVPAPRRSQPTVD